MSDYLDREIESLRNEARVIQALLELHSAIYDLVEIVEKQDPGHHNYAVIKTALDRAKSTIDEMAPNHKLKQTTSMGQNS